MTERSTIRTILQRLRSAGFTPTFVDNGEERVEVKNKSNAGIISELMATDISHLFVTKDGRSGWLFFVFGNSPEEVLSDYSTWLEESVNLNLED